jgi:hypothetical protein
MLGPTLKVLAFVGYALGIAMFIAAGDPEQSLDWLEALPILFVAGLIHFSGRQYAARARNTGPGSPLHDNRPDVLYLRSFGSDASTLHKKFMSGFSNEEEDLAEAVRPLGDLIAIGQPGEPLPLPGAARMYCASDDWKDTVLKRMREAPLVIIRAGGSAGLLWECEQAFATVAPNRLVILVFDLKGADYERFAGEIRRTLRLELPQVPRCSALNAVVDYKNNPSKVTPGFIMFSSGWRAEFVPLRLKIVKMKGYREFVTPFREALEKVVAV